MSKKYIKFISCLLVGYLSNTPAEPLKVQNFPERKPEKNVFVQTEPYTPYIP